MIEFANGRGQLGTSLQRYASCTEDVAIYHTWNILDKSEVTQMAELKKYERYLVAGRDLHKHLIFISTLTQNESPYLTFKRIAEKATLRVPNAKVIRIPTLIGKGICERFVVKQAQPFGTMELMTIDDAADEIMKNINTPGPIITISGERISANLARNLIHFGRNYEKSN